MLGSTAFCQVGINFEQLTFDEALVKAKAENKMVFMDCCTRWCTACKLIAKNVFTLEKVGDFMNKNFVCLKLDMEKEEGPELAKRFGVAIYPTFLIVEQDGTVRHRFIGNSKEDVFIQRVEEGLNGNTALATLAAKYNSGNRDKAVLMQYIKTLENLKDPAVKPVIEDLLNVATDEDKTSPDYWFIFKDQEYSPRNSDAMEYLLTHREQFYRTVGVKKVDTRLSADLSKEIFAAISGKGEPVDGKRLNAIGKEIKALKLSNERSLLASLAIAKAAISGDIDRLLSVCEKKLPQVQSRRAELISNLYTPFASATEEQKIHWQKIANS